MRLYYTSISGEDLTQTRSDLSLGGFRSGTVIPNNKFGNLFGDLSCYSINQNEEEFIATALKNETGAQVENVTIYLDYPKKTVDGVEIIDSQKLIEVSPVAFNSNNELEIIGTPYSEPYTTEFYSIEGVANAINIGSIPIDGQIGLWLKRVINKSLIEQEFSNENLEENGTPSKSIEEISLVISWD